MVKYPGKTFQLSIEKLGFGGEGIAHLEDLVIFVQGGIPGQRVEVVITKQKSNFLEARILKVLEKSPQEILPACAHFGICGGCKWQNLTYEQQVKYKEEQVQECLEHLGKISTTGILKPIQSSPQIWAYRNKVEFSFGYASMEVKRDENGHKIYQDENPNLGFHPQNHWETTTPIQKCQLISDTANQVKQIVADYCLNISPAVYNPYNHRGIWRVLQIRENLVGEIMLNLVVNQELEPNFWPGLLELLPPAVISVYQTLHQGLNDQWQSGTSMVIKGQSVIYEEILGLKFAISPLSFFQTNSRGASVLYQMVKDIAQQIQAQNILDLYCGTGTIGQILAGKNGYASIIGIDTVASAIKDAYQNSKLNGLNNVEFIVGAAEKVLPELKKNFRHNFDLIIVDPPRSGLHPQALQSLLDFSTKHLIYISCNPSTLARDLQLLSHQYRIQSIQAMDMFPHTSHIETVCHLSRA
ncbi:MAG TPA: 23S rRNA (uracil(1939)-C(5))-methyltransferase RlmD [Candidatus Gracilibacteria bacterium]|nr:23S rRNA (uracil(1939)-C(5))-methyltransferase RlmD [Candidatus Gracilibacteria bacterium]